jgi:hypothetical protein
MLNAAYGQTRPNFSGTWEFVGLERGGRRITFSTPGNTLNKETHIFAHQEPRLKIKMLLDRTAGPTILDLQYTTDGKTRPVGVVRRASGVENTVDDRLVGRATSSSMNREYTMPPRERSST